MKVYKTKKGLVLNHGRKVKYKGTVYTMGNPKRNSFGQLQVRLYNNETGILKLERIPIKELRGA